MRIEIDFLTRHKDSVNFLIIVLLSEALRASVTESSESKMKCPKCGYVSFDYSDTCPKCNKDLTGEREKMNLPPYRPNPTVFLGALPDEGPDLDTDLEEQGPQFPPAGEQEQAMEFSLEDAQALEADKGALGDDQDFEILLDTVSEKKEEPSGLTVERADEGLVLETEDLDIKDSKTSTPLPGLETADDAAFLDLGDLSGDTEGPSVREDTGSEREKGTSVDLEELASLVEDLTEDKEDDAQSPAPTEEEKRQSLSDKAMGQDQEASADLDLLDLDLDFDDPDTKSS